MLLRHYDVILHYYVTVWLGYTYFTSRTTSHGCCMILDEYYTCTERATYFQMRYKHRSL